MTDSSETPHVVISLRTVMRARSEAAATSTPRGNSEHSMAAVSEESAVTIRENRLARESPETPHSEHAVPTSPTDQRCDLHRWPLQREGMEQEESALDIAESSERPSKHPTCPAATESDDDDDDAAKTRIAEIE